MAGASTDFDAVGFRAQIRAAMTMGLPVDPAERPTFHFPRSRVHAVADLGGAPFDWRAGVDTSAEGPGGLRDPIQVPCAWETAKGGEDYTAVGEFNTDEALLTVLDVDFELVRGFSWVALGGNRYDYSRELPPRGLFDVTVHQVIVIARDES